MRAFQLFDHLRALFLTCAATFFLTALPAIAQQLLVVRSDRGGSVQQRVASIERIRTSGQRIEIRGPECLSACTMYLGAGDVCVSPSARFGFHGPSHNGQPLGPQDFERWSHVMADYYPPPVRRWFLQTARYRTRGYFLLSGQQLIAMGVPRC